MEQTLNKEKKIKAIKLDTHFWWQVLPIIGLLVWGALSITNNLWYDEAYGSG